MSRVRTLLVTVLPSMIAGGFLFASEAGHAEAGRDDTLGFWPESSATATGAVVAQADPQPPPTPAPPAPAVPAVPPVPPTAWSTSRGHSRGHGMTVSIHDGKVEISGLEEMVQEQLESVQRALDSLPGVTPDLRDKLRSRIINVRAKLRAKLSRLKSMDVDKIGSEVERIGDELEKDMNGIDKDLEQLAEKIGKHYADKFNKDWAKNFNPAIATGPDNSDGSDDESDDDDDDDNDSVSLTPSVSIDRGDPDVRAKIDSLKNLTLAPNQKAQLARLRAESEQQVAQAKRELEDMSNRLHDALGNASASEADVSQQIDNISRKEAAIRKARILTWMKVRKLLDRDQLKLIEATAKHGH
jgi:hypothetical protein